MKAVLRNVLQEVGPTGQAVVSGASDNVSVKDLRRPGRGTWNNSSTTGLLDYLQETFCQRMCNEKRTYEL